MLNETFEQACSRLDLRWAQALGVEPSRLRAPGVHYVEMANSSSRTYMEFVADFLAVLPAPGVTVVSAAPEVCEDARRALRGVELADVDRVSAALYSVASSVGCEDFYECDFLIGVASELSLVPNGGLVNASAPGSRDAVDWDGTVLADEVDGAIFVTTDDQGVTAWAGAKCVSPWTHDMQIATRPDCRGRGLGRLVTSAATRHMLQTGITPYYAYLSGNLASAAVARGLGFSPYGRGVFAETRVTSGGSTDRGR